MNTNLSNSSEKTLQSLSVSAYWSDVTGCIAHADGSGRILHRYSCDEEFDAAGRRIDIPGDPTPARFEKSPALSEMDERALKRLVFGTFPMPKLADARSGSVRHAEDRQRHAILS